MITRGCPPLNCHSRCLEAGRRRVLKNRAHHQARPDIAQALKLFNQLLSHQNYKLVEAGGMTPVFTPSCTIFHIDFTAKNANIARAPKEMFFAKLISMDNVLSVSLCECRGPINSVSGDNLNGCRFCSSYNNVQHPEGRGYIFQNS
ncbi:hypothetical protein POM88_008202 [Heracleum sosnowskyi]|uniref:DUF3615 domain-containing protein n=1 Tax=Heracleum sosnowskyi TaxID=360622 RepID=A0AAD8J7K5_9APIA|nr:hypothetical protein POM88_008202 [Heracleum sosnowskyi]